MQTLQIITVGKIKPSARYLQAGIDLYTKRLARDFKITWTELPEEAPSPTRPVSQILAREAEQIQRYLSSDSDVVLWSERGRLLSSLDLAQWLNGENPLDGGRGQSQRNRMIWIIGSAHGTAPQLESSIQSVFSLSPMTFPHLMVRLLVLEQLYRATTILKNEPYHK